jgi:glycosyltransferase involved in cell wall biosynthesis
VLILHPHLFVKGGGERLTKILAEGLKKLEDEVAVLTSNVSGGFTGFEGVKFFSIRRLPCETGVPLTDSFASLAASIRNVVEKFNPETAVSMTEDLVNLGICKLVNRKIRTVQYVHFPVEEEAKTVNAEKYVYYFRFPEWFNKCFLWAADRILCNSKYTGKAIEKFWGKKAKVVHPALDYSFKSKPENLGEPRENILLCVGRFTKLKRQDFLLKILRKIKVEIGDVKLILAGYPDERHRGFYQNLLTLKNRIEDVVLIENPSDDELVKLYLKAKVFCHPRVGEHFGLTPIEAMRKGAIVVAYNAGGIREVISHGRDGFLANNDQEYLRLVIKALKLKGHKWVRMQREAVKKAGKFSPERFVKTFRSFL